MIELFIILGGAYALYTVGMAIATELDYREVNKKWTILSLKKNGNVLGYVYQMHLYPMI